MPEMPIPGMPAPGGPPPGFPVPGGPPGGAPGGAPPPAATGAAAVPGGQAGTHAQGMGQVKTALEMLQKALPGVPMGGELHKAVMKAISDISKNLSSDAGGGGDMMQNLVALARQAQSDPARAAAMRAVSPTPGGMPAGMGPPPGAGQ